MMDIVRLCTRPLAYLTVIAQSQGMEAKSKNDIFLNSVIERLRFIFFFFFFLFWRLDIPVSQVDHLWHSKPYFSLTVRRSPKITKMPDEQTKS